MSRQAKTSTRITSSMHIRARYAHRRKHYTHTHAYIRAACPHYKQHLHTACLEELIFIARIYVACTSQAQIDDTHDTYFHIRAVRSTGAKSRRITSIRIHEWRMHHYKSKHSLRTFYYAYTCGTSHYVKHLLPINFIACICAAQVPQAQHYYAHGAYMRYVHYKQTSINAHSCIYVWYVLNICQTSTRTLLLYIHVRYVHQA
jgi:hypothetical protein